MQACPPVIVSTTRLSSEPQAVEMATSYLSSIRPRFPSRPYNVETIISSHLGLKNVEWTNVEARKSSLILELGERGEDVVLRSIRRLR